ncbi:uncharacterized protein LOC122322345 isoform X2 [Drosophila grimshawi]|uniref:GH13988 n=1 Tax=Drosophila grimshawi TaxID=7222 RepID=B4JTL7_DROGR|nr:uncharacterized protein LOC122322345 isoform X2 [Drosophila grimshawi]EDV91446.1 GH13988 [Drosophila grimshawi]
MFTSTEAHSQHSAEINMNKSNKPEIQDTEANYNSNNNNNNKQNINNKSNSKDNNIGLLLHSIDEHYACDIAMMHIAEEVGQKTAPENTLNSTENEVEIDPQEEEQAINQLVRSSSGNALIEAGNNSGSMRVVFGILVRLMLPLAHSVARGIKGIRDVHLLHNIASSRQALTNVVAFAANNISMNLSSVQVSNRLGPLLNLLKLRKSQDGLESLPDTLTTPTPITPITPTTPSSTPLQQPPIYTLQTTSSTCCTLNVLAAPPPGTPIRADIVLVHGLHGSLVNTWRQGLWQNERHPVEFDRPPKPPVRPPKRPRHLRTATIHPAPREKRAKLASFKEVPDTDASSDSTAWQQTQPQQIPDPRPYPLNSSDDDSAEDFAYVCGEPEDIQFCEGIEYSFPTFRVRMHDNNRLLQVDLESMLEAEANASSSTESSQSAKSHKTIGKGKRKPSANDPNYSKCWPGDWLPLDCPGVRVIAVNYTTDPYLWRPLWKRKEPRSSLIQRSREMASLLMQHRVGHGHPIIYVGHSKGGLFIKQLIVDAWESGRPAMRPLWRSARGCFFYSVPHRGSHLASIKAPLLSRSVELLEIEKNNKYLLDLHRRFAGLYHMGHLKIEVFSFVETALTLMSVLFMRIVGVDSADPGFGEVCGIRLDHREICKPRSRECILYKELVKMIKKVC